MDSDKADQFDRKTKPIALTALGVVITVSTFATPYMSWASLTYGVMVVGLINRKYRTIHSLLMKIAMGMDLAVVLVLEVSRGAIETAISFKLGFLQQLHIGCSTLALLLYLPVLYLGRHLLKGTAQPHFRKWHIRLGLMAFIFRTLGFFLMFSLLIKG